MVGRTRPKVGTSDEWEVGEGRRGGLVQGGDLAIHVGRVWWWLAQPGRVLFVHLVQG